MKKTVIATFVFFCITLPFISFGQAKIGYISADEIFGAMPETKMATQNVAEYQKAQQESYAQHEAELNAAYEKFVKDSARLTPAVKEARRQDLQTRISELQGKQTQLTSDLEAEKERQLKPIREKLMNAIKTVAKEMGYDHVLYKESAIVFPEAADLTIAVKKKMGIR